MPADPTLTIDLDEATREAHRRWLSELTATPTGAGHESRIVAWIERWLAARPAIARRDDPHGNIELRLTAAPVGDDPIYFTAHMDHPAFVVERVIGPATLELAFRGGVMDDYFLGARVRVLPGDGAEPIEGVVTGRGDLSEPFKSWVVDLDHETEAARPGDLATWALGEPEVRPLDTFGREVDGGCLHTPACDDLAALAAALAALDELRRRAEAGEPVADARLLLTRAEEIGFIGAIGASKDGFMPAASRVIALETSRSFVHDSPIGGGPIVRVGDRVSTFSPALTAAVSKVAESLAGGSAHVVAVEKEGPGRWRWQRKLMAGGACEASVFYAYGYEATCVCLPLGNYHNMADLDAAQAGTLDGPHRIARECIALRDFDGMVDLLIACGLTGEGRGLPAGPAFRDRVEGLWDKLAFVLRSESEPTTIR